jgi:hypothetical protein
MKTDSGDFRQKSAVERAARAWPARAAWHRQFTGRARRREACGLVGTGIQRGLNDVKVCPDAISWRPRRGPGQDTWHRGKKTIQ